MIVQNDYTNKLQQLLDERARHAEALVRIDEALERIGTILGAPLGGERSRPISAQATGEIVKRRPKRGRGAYEVTAEQFVLDFVGRNKAATTREINTHWKSVGRGHTADNTLVRLVKTRQLKRVPLEGQRGSRYTLA